MYILNKYNIKYESQATATNIDFLGTNCDCAILPSDRPAMKLSWLYKLTILSFGHHHFTIEGTPYSVFKWKFNFYYNLIIWVLIHTKDWKQYSTYKNKVRFLKSHYFILIGKTNVLNTKCISPLWTDNCIINITKNNVIYIHIF